MAIIAPQTALNFATGNYHRILKFEGICSPSEPDPRLRILVGFYASREARDANTDPMYVNPVEISFADLLVDPRVEMYELLMASPLFTNTNAAPDESIP